MELIKTLTQEVGTWGAHVTNIVRERTVPALVGLAGGLLAIVVGFPKEITVPLAQTFTSNTQSLATFLANMLANLNLLTQQITDLTALSHLYETNRAFGANPLMAASLAFQGRIVPKDP